CTEVGWRLKRSAWGQGFATEAARACLQFAFETMMLDEVVSFTSVCNRRSQGVMQRLQMLDSGHNFRHPDIPRHHLLSEHVLYKISHERWQHGRNSL
ncbi:MAG: GNAT family N-acetyltransferase, partial [Motiliproteus sp.]|nr:GNAT family N-acetyltransferase [Motiliproteus sp.]